MKREQAPGCSVEMKTFLLQISSLQIIPTGCCSNQASSKQTNLQKWNNNNCFDEFFFVEKNVEFNLEYLQNFWQRQWYTTSLDAYILLKLQQRIRSQNTRDPLFCCSDSPVRQMPLLTVFRSYNAWIACQSLWWWWWWLELSRFHSWNAYKDLFVNNTIDVIYWH